MKKALSFPMGFAYWFLVNSSDLKPLLHSMRKVVLVSTLLLIFSAGARTYAQDFSNKGKDFWVAYGYHQAMLGGGNSQNMVLYFAAEQDANVTVSIPGVAYTQTYFVPANSVVTSNPIPKAGTQDCRLL